jgi:hypothetical protein
LDANRLDELANLSVARGSGFGLLAVFCTMVGLAGYPVIALKTGGVCFMLGASILAAKAARSGVTPYRRTEVWLLLEPHERPPGPAAQSVIARARRDALIRYAMLFAYGAFGCIILGLAADLLSVRAP